MTDPEPTEREVKLAIPDAAALERVADAVHAGRGVEQLNIFYDTADGALRACGHGLRLRLAGGVAEVTLKGPNTGRAGAAVRREIGSAVAWATAEAMAADPRGLAALPGAALAAVRRITGGAPLMERLRFRNVRRTAAVRIAGVDCEACCDATTFPDGVVEYELEVEVPDAAALAPAERWAAALCVRLGLPVVPQRAGKASRAARHPAPRR